MIPDVPSHLHYIMLELIKNSMRATVDFHGLDEMDNNPIRVVIADGEGNEVSRTGQGGVSVSVVRHVSIGCSLPPPPFPHVSSASGDWVLHPRPSQRDARWPCSSPVAPFLSARTS